MKVVLSAIFDSEDDGVVGTSTITREDVDDLHSLAQAVGDFTRSCGYTYVNDVVRHATKVPESKMKFYLEGD